MGKWCVDSWDFLKLLLSQSMRHQTKVYCFRHAVHSERTYKLCCTCVCIIIYFLLVPVWLNNVMCNGTEASLAECPIIGTDKNSCQQTENAGVSCTGIAANQDYPLYYCCSTPCDIS